ncbi:MAG: hypothetical protein AB7O97_06265 [Planctomycetota bacterium]
MNRRSQPRESFAARRGELPWSHLDDTLRSDAPRGPGGSAATQGPVPPAAREWLADQRFMHGVLRAMHSADAHADNARVDSILMAIEREPRRRHRSALVVAAALLLCALVWPLLFVRSLPEAAASVLRGAELLGHDVDRRFRVESFGTRPGEIGHQEFELIARPGNRFVVTGGLTLGPIHFASMRFGSDGREFWFHSWGSGSDLPEVQRSGPLDEAPAVLRGIGNVLDLGLLNVHDVVRQLPQDFQLRTTEVVDDQEGHSLVHVEATGGPHRPGFHLHRADVFCDQTSGMIVRLEVEADDGLGRLQRFTFHHQGSADIDASIYERPW